MNNLIVRQNQSSLIGKQNNTSSHASLHLHKHKLRAQDSIGGKLLRTKAATTSTPKLLIVRSASQAGGIAAIHPKNVMERSHL